MELIETPVKLLPKNVTGTLVPGEPLDGLIEVRVGEVPVTWNVTVLLMPFKLDTTTLFKPSEEALNVAVIWLEEVTTLLISTPVIGLMDAPERFCPTIVIGTICPRPIDCGVMAVSIGGGLGTPGNTSKFRLLLSPNAVCTAKEFLRLAKFEMVKVAVIRLLLTTVTPEADILLPSCIRITVGSAKLLPAMDTPKEVPSGPLDGFTENRLGGPSAGLMVKVTGLLMPANVLTVINMGAEGASAAILNNAVT